MMRYGEKSKTPSNTSWRILAHPGALSREDIQPAARITRSGLASAPIPLARGLGVGRANAVHRPCASPRSEFDNLVAYQLGAKAEPQAPGAALSFEL